MFDGAVDGAGGERAGFAGDMRTRGAVFTRPVELADLLTRGLGAPAAAANDGALAAARLAAQLRAVTADLAPLEARKEVGMSTHPTAAESLAHHAHRI